MPPASVPFDPWENFKQFLLSRQWVRRRMEEEGPLDPVVDQFLAELEHRLTLALEARDSDEAVDALMLLYQFIDPRS